MDGPKRTRTPPKSERCVKMAKISHDPKRNTLGVETPRQKHSDQVQVTVRVRSASKAARHDPIPPDYWKKRWASFFSGRDAAGDSALPSSADDRAPSSPTDPPTAEEPDRTAAAQSRSELSASVNDPRPDGSDPVTGHAEESISDRSRSYSDEEDGHIDGFDDTSDNDGPDADESWYDSDRSSADEFAEWAWLEQIDGVAHDVDQNEVASCNVKLIRRADMRIVFWVEMEEPSDETEDLGFELFDRYGRLRHEYYDHEIRKGSGAWGQELDHGDILLFETLRVEPHWRHQGVGTKLVHAVLDKARAKSRCFFAFARPGCLTQELESGREDEKGHSEVVKKLISVSKHFWRSLGFRRVGTSGWLAFTDDNTHPARHLDVEQDWDAPERSKEEEEPVPEPIRAVLNTLSDSLTLDAECLRQVQEAFPVEEADAPSRLRYTDESGNTILHAAALGRKAETTLYILAQHPDLASTRNKEGYTPLEALRSSLEEHRTMRQARGVGSDKFEGFSQPDIACLAALTGTEILDLAKLSKQDISAASVSSATEDAARMSPAASTIRYSLRLKYGCTCGECIGGFLSPRMHFALLRQAEYRYSMLDADLRANNGPGWVAAKQVSLGYLAAPVRENLKTNKSMRQGFTNMCHHIACCLGEGRLPDEETVLHWFRTKAREWPPVTKHYLQRGGTVAAVATMLFSRAMHWDEWAGDGTLQGEYGDEIEKLPICRNDHEFGFVSGMCGYKRVSMVRYVGSDGREIE